MEKDYNLNEYLFYLKNLVNNTGSTWRIFLKMNKYLNLWKSEQYHNIVSQNEILEIVKMIEFHKQNLSIFIHEMSTGLKKCKEKYSVKRQLIVNMFNDGAMDDECCEKLKQNLENNIKDLIYIEKFLTQLPE